MRINIKHRSRVEFAQQEIQSIENEDLKRGTWRLKNGDRLKEEWTMFPFGQVITEKQNWDILP